MILKPQIKSAAAVQSRKGDIVVSGFVGGSLVVEGLEDFLEKSAWGFVKVQAATVAVNRFTHAFPGGTFCDNELGYPPVFYTEFGRLIIDFGLAPVAVDDVFFPHLFI